MGTKEAVLVLAAMGCVTVMYAIHETEKTRRIKR